MALSTLNVVCTLQKASQMLLMNVHTRLVADRCSWSRSGLIAHCRFCAMPTTMFSLILCSTSIVPLVCTEQTHVLLTYDRCYQPGEGCRAQPLGRYTS